MIRALGIACLTAAASAVQHDTIVMVTDNAGSTGTIMAYDGPTRFRALATNCPQPFTGVTADEAGDFVYAVSRKNVWRLALTDASSNNCAALSPVLPVDNTREILHAEVDATDVWYTDNSTYALMRAPLDGSTGPATIVSDGTDGVRGQRLAVSLFADTVIYTTNGVNASNAATPIHSAIQMFKNATSRLTLFKYSSSNDWWISESAGAKGRNSLIMAEFRAAQSNMNMQRLDLDSDGWGSIGGLAILATNLASQVSDTYLAYDATFNYALWVAPHSNTLNYLNATARNALPVAYGALNLPSNNGDVHGIHVVPGDGAQACNRLPYGSSGFPSEAVPCTNPEPAASASASPSNTTSSAVAYTSSGIAVVAAAVATLVVAGL